MKNINIKICACVSALFAFVGMSFGSGDLPSWVLSIDPLEIAPLPAELLQLDPDQGIPLSELYEMNRKQVIWLYAVQRKELIELQLKNTETLMRELKKLQWKQFEKFQLVSKSLIEKP